MAAVDAPAAEWRLGATGGASLASVRIDDAPVDLQLSSRTSFALGGLVSWRPSGAWSLELRPSYVGRGTGAVIDAADTEIEARFVELPLLLTRELGRGRVRPHLLAGAAIGRMTSARAVSTGTDADVTDDFARTDVSLRLGAGLRFPRSQTEPFVEAEYAWGLSDLNSEAKGLGAGLGPIRNRGLQVRAGISFRLGGD
jgi:hypothetical protein